MRALAGRAFCIKMAKRFRHGRSRGSHFLRQWREYRDLSEDQVATAMGISKASVSRVETGETPYTQDFIEAYALAVDCTAADLITRPPDDPDGLWSVWEKLRRSSAQDRARAARVLKAFFEEPAPEPTPAPETRRRRKS
jgi:transcriptional regulator with XRE-family HTH domain